MDVLPHTEDVEGYLALKATENVGDPTANAAQYRATKTIENHRRNEVDPRHLLEKPGIHVSGGKPGMSPRSKKNFVSMNKTHTGAFDNYQVNKQKFGKINAKMVTADTYSPVKQPGKKASAPKVPELKVV